MKCSQSNASSKISLELKDAERQKCEVWSRVMGYHRPVSGFNIGKKQEFADRLEYKEPTMEVLNGSVD